MALCRWLTAPQHFVASQTRWGMPLGIVTHSKHEYVRQCSIPLSTLHPKAKAAVLKSPAAVSARKYYFLAGDNCAEGIMGTAAQSRSRMNLNGRRTSAHAHINQLCCAYLARRPGFANVLEAYRMYRLHCMCRVAPVDTTSTETVQRWLNIPVQ